MRFATVPLAMKDRWRKTNICTVMMMMVVVLLMMMMILMMKEGVA
jgi:hypothetical protein